MQEQASFTLHTAVRAVSHSCHTKQATSSSAASSTMVSCCMLVTSLLLAGQGVPQVQGLDAAQQQLSTGRLRSSSPQTETQLAERAQDSLAGWQPWKTWKGLLQWLRGLQVLQLHTAYLR